MLDHREFDGKPYDFLGNEIVHGSMIVYPTGGSYASMVLAVVEKITYEQDGRYGDDKYGWHPVPLDTPRTGKHGDPIFRLRVKRLKESTFMAGSNVAPEAVEGSRPVLFTAIERCVVVSQPAGD